LFKEQRYTQSFEIYKSIYELTNHASPAMLLKMAYIKEGLGDVSNAQYFLNEYYLITTNELVLEKMEKLAETNRLQGYDNNDFTFFANIYYKYYNWVIISVSLLALILCALIIYKKLNKHILAVGASIMLMLTLSTLFYLVNFGKSYNKGMIIKNNTYVMEAPAAGSDVVDVIKKGHKVSIKSKHDVWVAIEWQDRTAYIKEKNVKPLTIW